MGWEQGCGLTQLPLQSCLALISLKLHVKSQISINLLFTKS